MNDLYTVLLCVAIVHLVGTSILEKTWV